MELGATGHDGSTLNAAGRRATNADGARLREITVEVNGKTRSKVS